MGALAGPCRRAFVDHCRNLRPAAVSDFVHCGEPESDPSRDFTTGLRCDGSGLNDDDLLQGISQQSPALQAQYTDNLRRVNEYIQDEKSSVAADPNDEDARSSLMEAYQQKAMLFQLALDRSLQ